MRAHGGYSRLSGVLGAALLAGCGGSVADRESLMQSGRVPALHGSEPIAVQAAKPATTGRTLLVVGSDLPVDYATITADVVGQVKQELSRQGVPVVASGSRAIDVVVLYVDLMVQGAGTQYACIVDMRVTLGNGTVRGLQGRENSSDPKTACSVATTGAAIAILNDPDVQRYITAAGATRG